MPGEVAAQPPAGGRHAALRIPARPVIAEMSFSEVPCPFVDGLRRTLGWQWQPDEKGGPAFVVIGRSALGGYKVLERYPLTEDGWQHAWTSLSAADAAAAQKVAAALAGRKAAQAARAGQTADFSELNARTLAVLSQAALLGGYGPSDHVVVGQRYDVRFLDDRLVACPCQRAEILLQLPYISIEDVEIGGPGLVRSGGGFYGGGFGAVGALEGMAVAAVLNALTTRTTITTVIRVQTASCELFLMHNQLTPQQVRIALSRPLGSIRAAQPSSSAAVSPSSASPVEELSKLASMLDTGLLTREEFDRLKARLLSAS